MKRILFIIIFILLYSNIYSSTTQEDIDHYNKLTSKLEKNREEFHTKGAVDLKVPKGSHLFWLEYYGSNVTLYRYDASNEKTIKYKFSINSSDSMNYRASDNYIVTAYTGSGNITYAVYNADKKKEKIDEIQFPSPSDGTRWHAYAVDRKKVYFIKPEYTSDEELTYTVIEWIPGTGKKIKAITTLYKAGVEEIGEFLDFDVFGNDLLFIESGRLWKLDLKSKKAKWLKNKKEIYGNVIFNEEGALYTYQEKTVLYFNYKDQSIRDITKEIMSNKYKINETYNNSHHYWADATIYKNYIIYTGNGGIFAFNMNNNEIYPVLLNPNLEELKRLVYVYPQVLDNGLLFVKGLYSESGSIGYDGPVYKINLKNILK